MAFFRAFGLGTLLLSGFIAFANSAQAQDNKNHDFNMSTKDKGNLNMPEDNLGLSDTEFWTDPFKVQETIQKPRMMERKEGVMIGAPKNVAIKDYESLPVIAVRVALATTARKLNFSDSAIITATNLNSYKTYAEKAILSDKVQNKVPKNPSPPSPTAIIGETFNIDLREQLSIPWRPSEYIVTVVMRDQATNRVQVKLGGSDDGYEDVEVEKFIEESRKSNLVPPEIYPKPGEHLPSYSKNANSLPLPKKIEISLSVPRVNVANGIDKPIMLGSFRLKAQRQHIIPLPPIIPGQEVPANPKTAVIPITLVLTGSEIPAPYVWPLVVPSYDPVEQNEEENIVTGHFAFDLLKFGRLDAIPQTYFIYAFSGETMVGPVPIAFVAEERLLE